MINRSIRVRVNNTVSKFYILHNGIPQGSPLSVVLFMIAFHSLNNIILRHKQIKLAIYADDAIVFSKCKNTTTLNNKFKEVLNEIQIWVTPPVRPLL